MILKCAKVVFLSMIALMSLGVTEVVAKQERVVRGNMNAIGAWQLASDNGVTVFSEPNGRVVDFFGRAVAVSEKHLAISTAKGVVYLFVHYNNRWHF